MTVFKGYLRVAKQNLGLFFLYLVIFFFITTMIQASLGSNDTYSAKRVKLGVVKEEDSTLAAGLLEYLAAHHEIILLENDDKVLQENLFYRNVEYIVRIPANFSKTCLDEGKALTVTKVPGSYTSFYVDEQINSFLNNAKTYYAAGYSETEIVDAITHYQAPEVTLVDASGNGGQVPGYSFYFRYIPYLFIAVLCYVLGAILSSFRKADLQKRMLASAVPPRRQSMQGLLATGLLAVCLWLICIIVSLFRYGSDLILDSGFLYYLINSFMMLLVALSLSYLIGMIVTNKNALSGIVNTLSLGMCFLCGVFVSLDVMSAKVKTVAQFLPVYWYEKANDTLATYGTITKTAAASIWQAIGIQFVFVIAFVCIALVISKRFHSDPGHFRK